MGKGRGNRSGMGKVREFSRGMGKGGFSWRRIGTCWGREMAGAQENAQFYD
jgi:hypothetical protein